MLDAVASRTMLEAGSGKFDSGMLDAGGSMSHGGGSGLHVGERSAQSRLSSYSVLHLYDRGR